MAKKAQVNGKSLVIVESPAKAKTINKYLGPGFIVKASMGHVRDLPDRTLGVDIENDFSPTYQVVQSRRKIINELSKASKSSSIVYLATDLDREGEAIAWHLMEALNLTPDKVKRVVFNEITESAITAAFASPRDLDMDKVNAQQARRTLDRIVGYQLSPLLWQKVAKGLSAGRVQSVAVRLIVEREWEIRAFVPTESWRVLAVVTPKLAERDASVKAWDSFLAGGGDVETGRTQKERNAWLGEHGCFSAELVKVGGQPFNATGHQQVLELVKHLGFICARVDEHPWEEYAKHGLKTVDIEGRTEYAGKPPFIVSTIQSKRTTSKGPAPFTTATLQQAASTHLGYGASRTMRVAQALYEGVDLGSADGPVGLITYMRTDSLNLSAESVNATRAFIAEQFGDRYLPARPNTFTQKKRAQEAHEAIRPTDVRLAPEDLKERLQRDQWKLYDLIWRRTVACQMTPAEWDGTTVVITAPTPLGDAEFKASGRRLVFDGYQRVYGHRSGADIDLPELKEGAKLAPLEIDPEQQYTSPPARYTEASLVKAMEADGIGRPSTYAAIIQTIQDRGYVEQIDRKFRATDKGEIVTEKLIEHFPNIVDVKFTSYMEDELDKIEEAHLDWVSVLREFYEPFRDALARAAVEMQTARSEPSEYKCGKCALPMVYRWARTGRFLSCTGYPECTGAYNVDGEGKPIIPADVDIKCDKCGSDMQLRRSRHGYFLGCSAYPKCSTVIPCSERGEPHKLVTEAELERPCEACGEGTMKVRRAGFRVFLGCDKYPTCRETGSLPEGVRMERKETPVEEAGFACERCGKPMRIRTGRRGKFISCSGFPRCRNAKPIEKLDELRDAAAKNPAPVIAAADESTDDAESSKKRGAAGKSSRRTTAGKTAKGKTDPESLGPPPPGFAWTRTGRPVVETWPEDDLHCPDCGGEMTLKSGRFGPFFSCSNFPRCKCSVNLRGEAKKRGDIEMPAPVRPKPIATDVRCTECGEKMLIRTGRTGPFLGCSGYPKCRTTQPVPEELAGVAATAV
ncbi:MAG: type I DNA topoisomerase [Phycisphaerales bacterium]|nr:type I DNA topoisomerase [Phycisphaerales bacterium]